jgi:nicotinate phosphoribosyltransferase
MSEKNQFVKLLLTDLYQLSMAYGYWFHGRQDEPAAFDLFFRRCPFGGEFAVAAGLSEVIELFKNAGFEADDIAYVKTLMPHAKPEFFEWLAGVDCSKIKVYAPQEGSIVFPRVPLLRVEGPLGVVQLLETTLLNLLNFPTLIATNAVRFSLAAGPDVRLMEFGLRRAQGPDGAMTGSRYSAIAFRSTSNVLAGKVYGLDVKGTHAHSWVLSFTGFKDIPDGDLEGPNGKYDFVALVKSFHQTVLEKFRLRATNIGELAAFTAYAMAFPENFLALVDTYDTLASGVPNYLAVALALKAVGYQPLGIRLDSGDLAKLSIAADKMMAEFSESIGDQTIVASNDIDEEILWSLRLQGHKIKVFGIGTHLITCKAQPALGGVYKLVEAKGLPRIKLSNDSGKMTWPARKIAYRLYGQDGKAILDLLMLADETPPVNGESILCWDPVKSHRRCRVTPKWVEPLHDLIWDGGSTLCSRDFDLEMIRRRNESDLATMPVDHLRPDNPTPYPVMVTERLYTFIEELWSEEAPVPELS